MNAEQLQSNLALCAPLIEAMRGCPQDPEWHAEGDAWAHTQMVRDALEAIDDFKALPEGQRNALRLAAALHDVGKPSSTVEVEGRLRAPGHARRSAEMLQLLWWRSGYDLEPEWRRLVLALVRYHARPVWGEERLEAHVAGTAELAPCRLLALLAQADMAGRRGSDNSGALLQIEVFRAQAAELGCLDGPYAWANAHAKYDFFRSGRPGVAFQAHDDRRFTVRVTSGLPASGKTTYAGSLCLPVVSRDEIREAADLRPSKKRDQGRTSQLFQEELRRRLRLGEEFVVDGTNLIRQLRANAIDLCANYGARVELHCFDRDRRTVVERNRGRPAEVPEQVIDGMAGGMELPESTEAHLVVRH